MELMALPTANKTVIEKAIHELQESRKDPIPVNIVEKENQNP